ARQPARAACCWGCQNQPLLAVLFKALYHQDTCIKRPRTTLPAILAGRFAAIWQSRGVSARSALSNPEWWTQQGCSMMNLSIARRQTAFLFIFTTTRESHHETATFSCPFHPAVCRPGFGERL